RDDLNVSRETLDAVSGLTPGFCSKLLSRTHLRRFGAASLGPVLGALGVTLHVMVDPDQMRRIGSPLGCPGRLRGFSLRWPCAVLSVDQRRATDHGPRSSRLYFPGASIGPDRLLENR